MAQPPPPRSWRCPCHADDILFGQLGPGHKHRKIKDAPTIEQSYSRGLRNNGFIEVEEEPDEGDTAEGFQNFQDHGRKYRLPEKGIILDFIEQ